jgi:hypothetical protein
MIKNGHLAIEEMSFVIVLSQIINHHALAF